MLIMPNINLILSSKMQYDDFYLSWSFGGNSSVVSLFCNGQSITSSEHWITDCSDIFSFDRKNFLSSMELSVPGNNQEFSLNNACNTFYGSLSLNSNNYAIEPMTTRFFDCKNKMLICFTEHASHNNKLSLVKLHHDFSFILYDGNYSGYILHNPLCYLTNEKDGVIDRINELSEKEYILMGRFMEIMSDNRVNELNNNMEKVILELHNHIFQYIDYINSPFRRKIVESTVDDLFDFYC